MSKRIKFAIAAASAALLLVACASSNAVPNPIPSRGHSQNVMVIEQAERAEVLERLIINLNRYYVFPDKAKAMETELRARTARGICKDHKRRRIRLHPDQRPAARHQRSPH